MSDLQDISLSSPAPGPSSELSWRGPRGRRPALCLPGFLGDARIFEPIAPALAERRSVLAMHLPPGAPAEAAALIERRLAALDLGPVHLLTGSFGGLVARCLPPERLASWTTVATLPDRDLIDPNIRRQARVLGALPSRLLERIYARHVRRSLARDGVPRDLSLRLAARGLPASTLLGRLRGVLDWELGPLPPCPTTWVLGDTDPQARWTTAEVLARCPEVTVSHVVGGHRPYASHPAPLRSLLEGLWTD